MGKIKFGSEPKVGRSKTTANKTKEHFYALRHIESKKLLRLSTSGFYYDGEPHVSYDLFLEDNAGPIFQMTLRVARYILSGIKQSHSSEMFPKLAVPVSELEIVEVNQEVVTTTTVAPVKIELGIDLKIGAGSCAINMAYGDTPVFAVLSNKNSTDFLDQLEVGQLILRSVGADPMRYAGCYADVEQERVIHCFAVPYVSNIRSLSRVTDDEVGSRILELTDMLRRDGLKLRGL